MSCLCLSNAADFTNSASVGVTPETEFIGIGVGGWAEGGGSIDKKLINLTGSSTDTSPLDNDPATPMRSV